MWGLPHGLQIELGAREESCKAITRLCLVASAPVTAHYQSF